MLKIRQYLPQNRPGDWRLYAAIAGGFLALLLLWGVFKGMSVGPAWTSIAGGYIIVGLLFWLRPAWETFDAFEFHIAVLAITVSLVVHVPTWPCYLLDEWGRDQN